MIIERLASVCRDNLLREKILVVPSLAIGHQIADAVAFSGTAWVNLRMETIRTISDAVAGFDLAERGMTVLSRAQALAIVERACDRVLDQTSYFSALLGRPGLYRAIQRSIDDLRHAGVRDALPRDAFEDPRKARDLEAIIGAYEEELQRGKFVDRYGVIAHAIGLLEAGATRAWSADALWLAADDLELSNTEQKLLAAAGNATLVGTSARGDGSAGGPAGLRVEPAFIRAIGEENELRHALRSIITLDEAEVVYTTRDPYLSLAYELTAEYGIPATFAEGIAAPFTRPGQAAIGFLQWIAGDYETIHLQRIARAGAIRTGDGIAPSPFARVLRESLIGWGRDRYAARIQAFIEAGERKIEMIDSESRREAVQREVDRRKAALRVAESLIEIASGGRLAEATRRFLDEFAATKNEIDAMALAALRQLLQELAVLEGEAKTTHARIDIDRLVDAISAVHVSASNPRPGHLHVTSIRGGGWSGRRQMFVVGLDDTKHPGAGLQDPIVLDEERTFLNSALKPHHLDLLGDMPAKNSARLRRLIDRAAHAKFTLSYSDLDLRDRRAHFPSKDLLDVFRSARDKKRATYEDLAGAATVSGFLERETPLSETEWWLRERFARGRSDLREQVLASHPWIAEGERARAARDSDAITEWDGKISADPGEIDPRLSGRVISASQMERMARCPFGWFLERVLHIAPVEELTREQDQWLDPRNFGLLVHEVLEQTMIEICDAGETPSLDRHLARINEIGDEAADRWRRDIPPASQTAFIRQRDELRNVCEVFLRSEEKRCQTVVPRFFEAPFGMAGAEESPIGITDPLRIPLGNNREVKLRGKIDRIDQVLSTGGWQVWDYKTGSLYEYTKVWRLQAGRKLQHVIYTRALTEMLRAHNLGGDVECAGYYFPTVKGGGELVERFCSPGELEHALNLLFDVVGHGWFPLPDEGACDFCEFKEICGDPGVMAARMAKKQQANANDAAVQSWRRLQEVE